ncbi:MAG: hypothetical protein WCD89_00545 [Anaerocolumna sp.]
MLSALRNLGSAVENDGLYYHAELYERARKETIKSRRSQIKTLPSESYAALLSERIRLGTPANEQLEAALKLLSDQSYPAALWESVLLPSRVGGYRPELLDTLLAGGSFFWHITPGAGVSFHLYEDINWEADLSAVQADLEGNEKIVYEELLKRGASFMQRFSSLLGGISPYGTF